MKQAPFIIFLCFAFVFGKAQTKNFIDQPYIEVKGSADTLVTPDEIFIKVIINEKDNRDKIAVEELEMKMVTGLKELGIDTDKDLTVNDMSSNFKFYVLKNKEVLKKRQYTLKVKNALTAGKVFIQLENLGISNASIEGVRHSELTQLHNRMRTKAVANAKESAMALTSPLNQVIGPAIHIMDMADDESDSTMQVEMFDAAISTHQKDKAEADEQPSVDFEKISISAMVNVKFILK